MGLRSRYNLLTSIEERVKQVLLVLRKDCRKFWPETLLTLAITSAFVWMNPYQWRGASPSAPIWFGFDWQHLQILANVVEVLLPVSWLILIARVVHDENLVGNRQFWLTRPYLWQLLLVEKLLFVAIFIGIPFTIAQVCLLIRAGISPVAYLPNLSFSLILIAGAVIVPIFALATVTSSLLRMIGTLLAIVAILLAIVFLASTRPAGPSVNIPYSDRITIIFAFCGTVLIAQYSARKLWLSRTLLVILLVTVGGLAMNPFAVSLLERIYQLPYPGHPNPIQVTTDTSSREGVTGSSWNGKSANLNIPLVVSGLPIDGQLLADDIRVTIDAADGTHWTSPWQAIYNHRFASDSPTGEVVVEVDKTVIARVHGSPVTLHVALAFTQLEANPSSTITFDPKTDFILPHVGTCTYDGSNSYLNGNFSCRAAFHQPVLTRITVVRSPWPCEAAYPGQPGAHPDTTWLDGPLHPDPADINFSPVQVAGISVPNYQPVGYDESGARLALCPGAPITITSYRLVRRFQYQMDLPNTQLPPAGAFVPQM